MYLRLLKKEESFDKRVRIKVIEFELMLINLLLLTYFQSGATNSLKASSIRLIAPLYPA